MNYDNDESKILPEDLIVIRAGIFMLNFFISNFLFEKIDFEYVSLRVVSVHVYLIILQARFSHEKILLYIFDLFFHVESFLSRLCY